MHRLGCALALVFSLLIGPAAAEMSRSERFAYQEKLLEEGRKAADDFIFLVNRMIVGRTNGLGRVIEHLAPYEVKSCQFFRMEDSVACFFRPEKFPDMKSRWAPSIVWQRGNGLLNISMGGYDHFEWRAVGVSVDNKYDAWARNVNHSHRFVEAGAVTLVGPVRERVEEILSNARGLMPDERDPDALNEIFKQEASVELFADSGTRAVLTRNEMGLRGTYTPWSVTIDYTD